MRLILLLLALAQPVPAGELRVFAAASLTEAFKRLATAFEASHPGTKIVFNFAGSQQLVQQLAHGAQADLLASADTRQMDAAVKAGLVPRNAARVFARNRLVIIAPAANPQRITTPRDLDRPGVKLVLAHKNVPAGHYALEMLQKAGVSLKNVVSYEENVKAVLAKVELGVADAGVVYVTDARNRKVVTIQAPTSPVAVYPLAILKDSALARDFQSLVLSPAGRRILHEQGFL